MKQKLFLSNLSCMHNPSHTPSPDDLCLPRRFQGVSKDEELLHFIKPFCHLIRFWIIVTPKNLVIYSLDVTKCKSSLLQVFLKVGVLENFTNFIGKHLCWNVFLIKLQA